LVNGPFDRATACASLVGGDGDLARHAAEARAQRAEIDQPVVAVARRSAGEEGEIALAAGIDEGPSPHRVSAGMVLPGDIDDTIGGARGPAHEGMQQHLDARLGRERVEHALHGLGLEHHEHAAMALRRGDGAQPPQTLHHLFGDAGHRLSRRIAQV
jgi:hypothetical protein